jgi:hypothetical protein
MTVANFNHLTGHGPEEDRFEAPLWPWWRDYVRGDGLEDGDEESTPDD